MAATTRTSISIVFEPPTRSNRRFLQDAQQLGLHGSGISPISSRKMRAPVGHSNRPCARSTAPVKAPFLVAEELAFEQVSGKAAQLTAMNGSLRARAALVHGAGDQLLAGAGLTDDQHGAVGLGDVADQLEHVVHPRALAQDAMERDCSSSFSAATEPRLACAALEGPLDHQLQMFEIDRFGEEIGGAQPHGLHGMSTVPKPVVMMTSAGSRRFCTSPAIRAVERAASSGRSPRRCRAVSRGL